MLLLMQSTPSTVHIPYIPVPVQPRQVRRVVTEPVDEDDDILLTWFFMLYMKG